MSSTVAPEVMLAGRYRLVRRLASGGMGQVWRANDDILGRPVAVKLLRSEYAEDPEFVDRFRAEARRTAALSHPGIASVFDYGETGDTDAEGTTAYLSPEQVACRPSTPAGDVYALGVVAYAGLAALPPLDGVPRGAHLQVD